MAIKHSFAVNPPVCPQQWLRALINGPPASPKVHSVQSWKTELPPWSILYFLSDACGSKINSCWISVCACVSRGGVGIIDSWAGSANMVDSWVGSANIVNSWAGSADIIDSWVGADIVNSLSRWCKYCKRLSGQCGYCRQLSGRCGYHRQLSRRCGYCKQLSGQCGYGKCYSRWRGPAQRWMYGLCRPYLDTCLPLLDPHRCK